jgi:predicted NUDIX family NTP pyrophosphohydrolase
MYRHHEGVLEILLLHPGGPYWARKENGAWTIPKGEIEQGEEALAAAEREFEEETGLRPKGNFCPLSPVSLKSGKTVYAWAFEGNWDATRLESTTFSMEWPPHSGRKQEFPEADRAGWFTVEAAREKIQGGQIGFIEEIERMIGKA